MAPLLPIAASDGGDDRDLVAVLDRRLEVLEEADVLVVGEDVHEAAHLARVVADTFLGPGGLRLEVRDERADRGAARGDLFLPLRQLAERRRNADGSHGGISFTVLSLLKSQGLSNGSATCGSTCRRSLTTAVRSAAARAACRPA